MSTHLSVTSKAIVCVGCFRTAWRSRANWPTLMWPPGPTNTWTVGSPCRWTQLRARAVTTTATTAEARWKLCTSVTRVSHLTWRWGTGPGSLDANTLLCSRDIEFVVFLTDIRSEIWSCRVNGSEYGHLHRFFPTETFICLFSKGNPVLDLKFLHSHFSFGFFFGVVFSVALSCNFVLI